MATMTLRGDKATVKCRNGTVLKIWFNSRSKKDMGKPPPRGYTEYADCAKWTPKSMAQAVNKRLRTMRPLGDSVPVPK